LEFPPLLVAASYASSAFSVGCGRLGVGGAYVVSVGSALGVSELGITSASSAVATALDATVTAANTPSAMFFPTPSVASTSSSSRVVVVARVTARRDRDDVAEVARVVARVAATRGARIWADMTIETVRVRACGGRERARDASACGGG
jgi:hypothetical protein